VSTTGVWGSWASVISIGERKLNSLEKKKTPAFEFGDVFGPKKRGISTMLPTSDVTDGENYFTSKDP